MPAIPRLADPGERPPAGRDAPRPEPRRGLRPEIQALRALAVGVVILNHSWPAAVPGGFVGVDVFFAISGFLITGHLVREVQTTGRVSLRGFWARRARRILPAALLVLFCVVLATLLVVPENRWEQFLLEARASALYVENWRLAATATDYFATAGNVHSPVQHYWSLSVEEQFYIVWPLVIGGASLASRRLRTDRARRAALAAAIGALGAVSLAYGVAKTGSDPAAAYFVSPTRGWELAAGALLAVLPVWHGAARARAAVSWLGLAAIAVAVFAYDSGTPFPGYAALLPVAGAVAVIAAGAPRVRWAPTRALSARPAQFVGDISYPLYLWHWPLLVLLPFALERTALGAPLKVGVIGASVLAAWATKAWVEDPVRSGPLLARRPARWTFGSAVVGTAVVAALTFGGIGQLRQHLEQDERTTRQTLAERPRCFGAAARATPGAPCENPRLRYAVVPSPAQARKIRRPCNAVERTTVMTVCAFGRPPRHPRATAVLVGDSHAMHLQAAVQVVARRHGWRALLNARSHCAFSTAVALLDEPDRSACQRRNRELPGWFRRHPDARVAFVAQLTSGSTPVRARPGVSQFDAQVAGYERAWRSLPRTVERIVVLRDTPRVPVGTLDCVEQAMVRRQRAGVRCAVERARAILRDPAAVAARRIGDRRVRLVDLNAALCDHRRCYPVVGGVLAYKDPTHLTTLFARTLGPLLDRQVHRVLRGSLA